MRELCVIYNPVAGKRRGEARLKRIRDAWGDRAEFVPTDRPGHGGDLARAALDAGVPRIAAAGGDGTVHDVATGLLQAGASDARFGVIPIGSANDFAYGLRSLKGDVAVIDVGRAQRDDGVAKFFICNLGMGFNGSVTVESRRIPWLQGTLLYGFAALRALVRQFDRPTFEIAIDDRPPWTTPTLMLSVLTSPREGGFVMAPDAKLDDGKLDFVHAGALSRLAVLGLLPRLALFGPPEGRSGITRGECRSLRIRMERSVNVHVDGEFLCLAEDGFRNIAIDVVPKALTIDLALSRRGGMPEE